MDLTPEDMRQMCRESLGTFATVCDPQYNLACHIEILTEALEYIEQCKWDRLMISMPPRHSKSQTASINFPAWYMGRHPSDKIAMVTYSDVLSKKNGGMVRQLMDSPLYQEIFPDTRLSKTTRAKDYFQTTAGGECLFTTVGGQLTGFGANCIYGTEYIATAIGDISISDLCDMADPPLVLSYCFKTKGLVYRKIVAKMKTEGAPLVEVVTTRGHTLWCTPDHRIYAGDRFVEACQSQGLRLQDGDQIVKITKIDGYRHTVYDLQIEDTQNFYAQGILCHNCLIIDDPLKGAEEAKSQTIRNKLTDFYSADASTRLMPDGRVIIISTRWHEGDLTGWLLNPEEQEEVDNWNVLSFPAIAEKDEGWRQEGDALWPEMWPLEKLERIKKHRGPWVWASLYQCRPNSIEGREVKREWWRYYDWDPYMIVNKRALGAWMTQPYFIFQSWDTASKTDQQHDYSVCTTWLVTPSGYYLLDVWRRKVISAELFEVAKQMAGKWGAQFVLVEHASHAISFIQALQSQTGLPIIPIVPRGDKEARMRGVAPLIFSGRVFLPRQAYWLADYMNELSSFPTAAHDDQVDSTSQLLHYCSMEDWRQKLMEQEEGDYLPPPDPFDV